MNKTIETLVNGLELSKFDEVLGGGIGVGDVDNPEQEVLVLEAAGYWDITTQGGTSGEGGSTITTDTSTKRIEGGFQN